MTNHSAAPAAPHSADALKQTERSGVEFEKWWESEGQFVRAGGGDYEKCFAYAAWNRRPTPADCESKTGEWSACQLRTIELYNMIHNRRPLNAERINPTPASPSLDNEAAARLRKQAEEAKKVRGVVALSPEDAFALLGCLERAEALVNMQREALDLVADTQALRKKFDFAEAAAGAVPDGYVLVPQMPTAAMLEAGQLSGVNTAWSYDKCYRAMIAAAPPAQGLPAAPAIASGCAKCGAKGIHACPGAPIQPWTPEKIAEFNSALSEYETEARPAAAPSEPTINQMCERKTNHIMERDGYVKTGYVLRKPGADREVCVSDGGAVSWFTLDQWNWLMFNRDHVEFAWPKPHGAAPSEPVAWYTDDHLADQSATTWDSTVAQRWRAKGWPVGELFATPPAQGAGTGEAGKSHPYHRDLEGLNQFISAMCGGNPDKIALAEAAWYQCRMRSEDRANSGRTE